MTDEVFVSSKEQSTPSKFQPGDIDNTSNYGRHRPPTISIFIFMSRKQLIILLPALLLTVIAGAIKPVITILLGRIFDELISFGSGTITAKELLDSVSKWCVALTSLGIATMIFNGAFFCLWLVFGEMQARSLRDKVFQCLIRNNQEWYDLRADGICSLLVRIQTQIRELQMAASQPLGFFIEDTAATLAALGIAFYYSWNLTLVILCFVPLTIIVLAVFTRKLKPAIENQKRDLSEATKYSYTAIKEVDIVKISNGQEKEIWQYLCAIKKATNSYLVQANANSSQIGVARFMTTAMYTVGFSYGIVLYRKGLDSGSVLTTFYSCLMATQAAEALLPQWLVLAKGFSAGETLKQILFQSNNARRISKMAGNIKPTTCHGDVEMSQITFSYPSNPYQNVIENASFYFPAGEITFVVGRSGSGKSTLGNLLTNFYQPSSGTISIDGQSIQALDLAWLRRNVSYVQQESILFNESLLRNISFGSQSNIEVTENQIKIACQIAMLQQTINDLPDGLQTMINGSSNSLSGGQRQRVAVARARLHNAPILILDEATSALDQACRSLVMKAIRQWRHGKTTIVITHDISEIEEKDYVYVLDQGRIVQEGYRQRLLEKEKSKYVPFEFISHGDSKGENGNNSMISSLKYSNSVSHEMSTSSVSVSSESEWPQTHYQNRSRLNRVSQLFTFDKQISRYGNLSNQRLSRGVGMGSIFTNTLHMTDTWQTGNVSSLLRPLNSSIAKPLPALPNRGQARRVYRSDRTVPDEESVEVEMINARGTSTLQSRLRTGELQRKVLSPENMDLNPSTSISSVIGHEPYQPRDRTRISPGSHHFEASMSKILQTLWANLNGRDRMTLILGFICAFISAAATPAFSYVLARLLGTFSMASGQTEAAKKWALAILAIAIADGISSYYMHYLLEYCGQAWISHLRVEALKRILAQPRAWFDKLKNNPGRLSECLDRDAEEMRNIVGRFAGYMFLAGSMVSIAIVWAFIVCWKLTLVSLASGPCMYAFTRAFEIVSGKWEKKLNEMAEVTGDIFTETFSKIKTVRALSLESHFEEKYSKATVDAYQVGLRRAVYTSIFFGLSDSTNSFVTALILYYGAVIAASGAWNINSILQVITLLLFSSGNANAAIAFIPQISSSRTAAAQLLHLANMPRTASQESQGNICLPTPLPIRFNSLSFSYPSQPALKTLHNISLTIPAASSCTALVGPSGSGKSTIASLLVGLLPPSEPLHPTHPSLTFHTNSVPISSLDMRALRTQIALVPQSPVLFPTTIAANLTYGLPPHSPLLTTHNIQSAARAAGIHDFIRGLPLGYDTRIGDSGGGGVGLSGGQAQRLCIARALARRPHVLVLDEPTSALDGESAAAVAELIQRLVSEEEAAEGGGMAVVLITHSVRMMRVAGRIVVLEKGRVVQAGSFEELLRCRGGPFERLLGGGGAGDGAGGGESGSGQEEEGWL